MRGTIAVSGSLAQRPGRGGHTWVFLQYLIGFRRLGWDVVFVDRLDREMCEGGQSGAHVRYFRQAMERFGLGSSYSLLVDGGTEAIGISRRELCERLRSSSFLLNVMGFLDDEEILAQVPLLVFLDIDPGFAQMWKALGLHDSFAGHDVLVTIGENIGGPSCGVPTSGLSWITTKQPVVLEHWPVSPGGESFTTIGSWRGPNGPIEYNGRTYGLRAHEFRRFFELPRRTGAQFEIALDIDATETVDLQGLTAGGWRLVDPFEVATDVDRYRAYLQGSLAELMVAKNLYVDTASGWFSDRSACYLASGKPVVAQDTGLEGLLPLGEGLLVFSTIEEATVAVEEVVQDYRHHAYAARALAEEHFDSDIVLSRLLDKLPGL